MPVARYTLVIDQGVTFRKTFTWRTGADERTAVPVDLTGCTARLQVRQDARAETALIDVSDTPNAQGSITLGGTAGTIAIEFDPLATALWLDSYGFGIELGLADGSTKSLIDGSIKMNPRWVR